jgi:RNA polymerase-binding transcription factor DksA
MKSIIVQDAGHEDQHAADPVDRAGAEVEASNREAREAHQRRVKASGNMPDPLPDGTCANEMCGEQVEEERAALGLGLCLDCAQKRERMRLRKKRGF